MSTHGFIGQRHLRNRPVVLPEGYQAHGFHRCFRPPGDPFSQRGMNHQSFATRAQRYPTRFMVINGD